MTFRTQFSPRDPIFQNPGSPVHDLYSPIFDERGRMHLEKTGQENLYDYIQSHADSVDIHIILKQFAAGDVSVLSRVQGAYGDFTQMPKTFAEALNTMVAAEQYFLSLSPDVRAQFNHNFNEFIAAMDQSDFSSKLGIDLPSDPAAAAGISSSPGSVSSSAPASPPAAAAAPSQSSDS